MGYATGVKPCFWRANTPYEDWRPDFHTISQNGVLFCLDAQSGKTLWTTELGGRGFGSVVDTGSALLALTPKGELSVFEPSDKEYKKLATYKVADTDTYAYPVPAGKGLFVKDKDALRLWAVD